MMLIKHHLKHDNPQITAFSPISVMVLDSIFWFVPHRKKTQNITSLLHSFHGFNNSRSFLLPLKCCLPHWRRWGRLWLPARCQIPAASADGRGGASCRPALTRRTAEPEPPLGRARRELRSRHDTGLAHLPAQLLWIGKRGSSRTWV